MASVTLAESAKLAQDQLIAGVIENVVTVNPFFEILPFEGIDGNAIAYNRENVLGDVEVIAIDTTITAKAAATFTKVTDTLTTILGDAEVSGLIQATRSAKTDQTGQQVASKAKNVGRKYQDMLINGTGSSDQFTGLLNLVDSGQSIVTAAGGSALTFTKLDELIDLVTAKDGEVDFLTMHSRTHRKLKDLLRTAAGGATMAEFLTLPSGRKVLVYQGIPVFRNDWISVLEIDGAGSNLSSVYAGTIDDGSQSNGISGLTAQNAAGIQVVDVGEQEAKDNRIWRVKWYCGLSMFSALGLARLSSISA